MKSKYLHSLWVTGAAITSQSIWKNRTNICAENFEENVKQPLNKERQKSCIIVVGTTGMLNIQYRLFWAIFFDHLSIYLL